MSNPFLGSPIDSSLDRVFPNNTCFSLFPELALSSSKPIFYDLAYDYLMDSNGAMAEDKSESNWFFGLLKK